MSERLRNARAPIWLLEVGADTEAKDKDGNTALDWAREYRHTSVVKLLPAVELPAVELPAEELPASSGCCVVM